MRSPTTGFKATSLSPAIPSLAPLLPIALQGHLMYLFLDSLLIITYEFLINPTCSTKCLNELLQVKLVSPSFMPKLGKGGSLQSRQALLHSLVHIESWAIDLSWVCFSYFYSSASPPPTAIYGVGISTQWFNILCSPISSCPNDLSDWIIYFYNETADLH